MYIDIAHTTYLSTFDSRVLINRLECLTVPTSYFLLFLPIRFVLDSRALDLSLLVYFTSIFLEEMSGVFYTPKDKKCSIKLDLNQPFDLFSESVVLTFRPLQKS